MISGSDCLTFTHNGIEVAIRLREVVEIEVRASVGKRPTLAISARNGVGLIQIGKEQVAPDLKLVKR